MKAYQLIVSLFAATAMTAAPIAMADMSRTESTIVGAAVGGVAGSAIGGNMESTLLGAAAGGLLGNLIAKSNSNYTREGRYNNRYYYGGREFQNRKDYDAYREAVRRDMLRDKEASRYQEYRSYRSQKVKARGNNERSYRQSQSRNGNSKFRTTQKQGRGYGHRH